MLLPASTGSGESDFFFNDTAATEIYTLSLHDALPISGSNTPEVVLAVLEMFVVREESTFTTRTRELSAPRLIVDSFHSTTTTMREPPPKAETKLVPAGIASDRLTPAASDGPIFMTGS